MGTLTRIATERVGFEPTEAFASLDFKSSAFDHSATSPEVLISYSNPEGFVKSPAPLAQPGRGAGGQG